MMLFKYTSSDGKDIVTNSRLKVDDPNNYNDPFEFALNIIEVNSANIRSFLKSKSNQRAVYEKGIKSGGISESWEEFHRRNSDKHNRNRIANGLAIDLNADLKKILNQQDGSVTDYFLLCCFCGHSLCPSDEVLMWAHYSDGLRGLRFSLDTDLLVEKTIEISKVQYLKHIAALNLKNFLTKNKDSISNALELSLGSKRKSWEYEQEYRWFVDVRDVRQTTEGLFVPINLNAIKRIDFGAKCSLEVVSEISKRVRDLGLKAELKRAVLDAVDFKLKYNDL
jgi:hypothetical protein